jgi:hypothetical protein
VNGSVIAATLAPAHVWTARYQSILTGDKYGGFYPSAYKIEAVFDLTPRVDGIGVADLSQSSLGNADSNTDTRLAVRTTTSGHAASSRQPEEFTSRRWSIGWCHTERGGPSALLSAAEGTETPVWLALDAPQSSRDSFVKQ